MAFDTTTFRTRALTAIVFTIVMLAGLLWNRWSFIILISVIHFGCWFEFIKLLKKINPKGYGYYLPSGLLYITLPVLLIMDFGFPDTGYLLSQYKYKDAFQYSPFIPCIIIFSIWINDTMAYIVGSLIGKTSLSKISPKKTWEGTIGGALLAVLLIGFLGKYIFIDSIEYSFTGFYTSVNSSVYFIIPFICAIFGTLGDLLESKLKRMAKVKDSGTVMPGHGGFLDRFDSLLIASIAVGLYYFFCI